MRAAVNGSVAVPAPESASALDDPRVVRAVQEYLAAAEAGGKPSRSEFVARYPDIAEPLGRCLAGLEFVQAAAPHLSQPLDGVAPPDGAGPVNGTLGDFRILREVGRGGMGVVYEAEQISLGRRVALKVLPLAAALDSRHLQRFHNEARAAAGLHHSHIVPVYGVGSERGVHFYAMQYIDGLPLDRLLDRLRRAAGRPAGPAGEVTAASPPPQGVEAPAADASTALAAALSTERAGQGREYYRTVARWGVQAAEALDYAHQVGVVHRDIKPGNLLLEERGQLWVTDFGLARIQSEASVTATGDLVGTLRYMSPEQALAKRVAIDHRTDVYSLGATLYELLTLQPACPGTDRQELLRQIAFEEPVPPRRRERAVPAELETVVLKAMEKAPQDRYATAQDLADDLRRWLDDRPIGARRPSLLHRLRKWRRRHRAAVSAGAAVLLLALVVGVGAAWWWTQKRVWAETETRAAHEEATRLGQEERWAEALSAVRRAEEVVQAVGVSAGLDRAVKEMHKDLEMGRRLQEARLRGAAIKGRHFDEEAVNAAYTEAFRSYGLELDHLDPRAAGERLRGRIIATQLAAALDHWADVRRRLGRTGWRDLLAVSRVVDPDPWRDRLRDALERKDLKALDELAAAANEEWPSTTAELLFSLAEGTSAADKALAVLSRARQKHPADFWVNHSLGLALSHSKSAHLGEAIRYLTVAVALRPLSPAARVNLGVALRDHGRLDEAFAEFQEAVRLKRDFALARHNLGVVLHEKGRVGDAIAEFRAAVQLDKNYAEPHYSLGFALAKQGQLDEAVVEYREAIRLGQDRAEGHNNLGVALQGLGRLEEAIAEYRKALRLTNDNAEYHRNLGLALREQSRLNEAITELRQAIRLRKDFQEAHDDLGFALMRLMRMDEAMAEFREAIRLNKSLPSAHTNLANALKYKGLLDEAVAECQLALQADKDNAAAHCTLGLILWNKGQFRQAVEELRRGHELGSRNPKRWHHPSAQWLREAERLADLDARLPEFIRGEARPADVAECMGLAALCQEYKKLYAAAAHWYGEAFDARPAVADLLPAGHRYNAACAAALAGCGRGNDAKNLDSTERARFRMQALAWLSADLRAWLGLLDKEPKAGAAVAQKLDHWLADSDFAGVRSPSALAKLPGEERQAWLKLWADVAQTLARAEGKAVSEKQSPKK
jgi:serine/threonine protein kinase/Flp pilus assembly protein TadD